MNINNVSYRDGYHAPLDGLRGLAIILVIFYHCLGSDLFFIKQVSTLGWCGVDLFFVLSGFLITGKLLDSKTKNSINLSHFFFNRAIRILPVYVLCLVIVFGSILLFELTDYHLFIDKQIVFWTFTENIYFAFSGWPSEIGLLSHFWSLAIEAQFYLIWPFVIIFVPKNHFIKVCISIIIVVLTLRYLISDPLFSYFFTPTRRDGFIFGAITIFLLRENLSVIRSHLNTFTILALAALLSTYYFSSGFILNNHLTTSIGFSILALSFSILIVWTYSNSTLGKRLTFLFSRQWIKKIGRYSYGIYAYHWILYKAFFSDLQSFVQDLEVPFYNYISTFIFLIIVYLLSAISYELYEKRFLAMKK